jgi:glutamate N-acetyltransferase/amino-acid N-acetyltransferase
MAGMAKGSGMIQPNMATTLGFVVTDAIATPAELQAALKKAIAVTFNCLTVDGDTSTNDTVAVLANGASGVRVSKAALEMALTKVLESLAKQIAADGEGARKLITIDVEGAMTREAATKIARAIANSPLVKTAIAGSDPNWGRILAAAGYAGVKFDPAVADVYLQGVKVCQGGLAGKYSEPKLIQKLNEAECHIRLVLGGKGKASARMWTCDFTEGYIQINGSYRT